MLHACCIQGDDHRQAAVFQFAEELPMDSDAHPSSQHGSTLKGRNDTSERTGEHGYSQSWSCQRETKETAEFWSLALHGHLSVNVVRCLLSQEEVTCEHPMHAAAPGILNYVNFVNTSEVTGLSVPWPRQQEATAYCVRPKAKDLVVAISHGWPYQAHPDPLGEKIHLLEDLVRKAAALHNVEGRTLMFFDFLSVPQRPFTDGQAPRTEDEEESFKMALQAMPYVYLQADVVVHLDMICSEIPDDGQIHCVSCEDLKDAELMEVGQAVQVTSPCIRQQETRLRRFDFVEEIDGTPVSRLDDVQRLMNGRKARCMPSLKKSSQVVVRRAPFGRANKIPPSKRGWIFLERFITMIKAAMVDESDMSKVALSNRPEVMQDIAQGACRLRKAAQAGEQSLRVVMDEFLDELARQRFSGTSTDAAACGGVGNFHTSSGKQSVRLSGSEPSSLTGDGLVVASLMQDLVVNLPRHWSEVARKQHQRQFLLAVNDTDFKSCESLLKALADPNQQDEQGWTCLHHFSHSAIRKNVNDKKAGTQNDSSVRLLKLLLDYGADVHVQDVNGNCPAHVLCLVMVDSLVPLFELLAPSEDVLTLKNYSGVSPLERFHIYSLSANDNKPFVEAQNFVMALKRKFGRLSMGTLDNGEVETFPTLKEYHQLLFHEYQNDASVSVSTEQYLVGDRPVSVRVWAANSAIQFHVLYFALSYGLPWALQKGAVNILARSVCLEHQAKVFVVDQSLFSGCEYSLAAFHSQILSLVDALPLLPEFFLIDSSAGLVTPALWEMQARLRAVMVLNTRSFHSEKLAKLIVNKITAGESTFVSTAFNSWKGGNIDWAVKTILNMNTFLRNETDIAHADMLLRMALSELDQSFFDYMAHMWLWHMGELPMAMHSLPSLANPFPVMVVHGSYSSAGIVQDCGQRLARKMDSLELFYIPASKIWWEIEGLEQVQSVRALLNLLFERGGAADKENSKTFDFDI